MLIFLLLPWSVKLFAGWLLAFICWLLYFFDWLSVWFARKLAELLSGWLRWLTDWLINWVSCGIRCQEALKHAPKKGNAPSSHAAFAVKRFWNMPPKEGNKPSETWPKRGKQPTLTCGIRCQKAVKHGPREGNHTKLTCSSRCQKALKHWPNEGDKPRSHAALTQRLSNV